VARILPRASLDTSSIRLTRLTSVARRQELRDYARAVPCVVMLFKDFLYRRIGAELREGYPYMDGSALKVGKPIQATWIQSYL